MRQFRILKDYDNTTINASSFNKEEIIEIYNVLAKKYNTARRSLIRIDSTGCFRDSYKIAPLIVSGE